jgi:phospholipase/carboxylesterase
VSDDMNLLHHVVRPAAAEPGGALVLFHGRGVDERDLAPLLDELDPQRRLVGLAPRAPFQLPGAPGYHWYAVREIGFPDPDTFLSGFERVATWLDAVAASTGVPAERTVLGGFSQGAVMSYALGLAAGLPVPAAILAMSGFIPTVEGWQADLESRRGLPVAITHGTLDPVIGVEFGRAARELLEQAGLDVTYRESPIGHGIDPRHLPELAQWLRDLERLRLER